MAGTRVLVIDDNAVNRRLVISAQVMQRETCGEA